MRFHTATPDGDEGGTLGGQETVSGQGLLQRRTHFFKTTRDHASCHAGKVISAIQNRMNEPAYPINSVGNALRLIGFFRSSPELRLSEAAELLGVANSTAHRLLAMLGHHGFVAQDPATKGYQPGPALFDIGLAVVRSLDIRCLARSTLEALAEETGETCHLARLEGTTVLYLDGAESSRAVRVVARTGMRLPAHCTSVGKVLLAELDPSEVRARYPVEQLPSPVTARSITERSTLERELAAVRRRGYAANMNESEEGLSSVAVAVRDSDGRAVAAIACSAPSARLPAASARDLASVLVERVRPLATAVAAESVDR